MWSISFLNEVWFGHKITRLILEKNLNEIYWKYDQLEPQSLVRSNFSLLQPSCDEDTDACFGVHGRFHDTLLLCVAGNPEVPRKRFQDDHRHAFLVGNCFGFISGIQNELGL